MIIVIMLLLMILIILMMICFCVLENSWPCWRPYRGEESLDDSLNAAAPAGGFGGLSRGWPEAPVPDPGGAKKARRRRSRTLARRRRVIQQLGLRQKHMQTSEKMSSGCMFECSHIRTRVYTASHICLHRHLGKYRFGT